MTAERTLRLLVHDVGVWRALKRAPAPAGELAAQKIERLRERLDEIELWLNALPAMARALDLEPLEGREVAIARYDLHEALQGKSAYVHTS